MAEADSSKFKTLFKKHLIKIIITIIVLVLLLVSVSFYIQYQSANKLLQNPSQAATLSDQAVINSVGKLMVLPTNETPTIATVSDKSKLSGQPFFANAQNGDKVLIYSKSQKAILYRPSIN